MEFRKLRPNPAEEDAPLALGGCDVGLEPGKPFVVVEFPGLPLETGSGSDSPIFASSILVPLTYITKECNHYYFSINRYVKPQIGTEPIRPLDKNSWQFLPAYVISSVTLAHMTMDTEGA